MTVVSQIAVAVTYVSLVVVTGRLVVKSRKLGSRLDRILLDIILFKQRLDRLDYDRIGRLMAEQERQLRARRRPVQIGTRATYYERTKHTMSNFPFKAGDKITATGWNQANPSAQLEILYVGTTRFFCVDAAGRETSWEFADYPWIPWVEPAKPVSYYNLYGNASTGVKYDTLWGVEEAFQRSTGNRTAVLVGYSDGHWEVQERS